MPTEFSSYSEKCRAILPEIDKIFKQYNVLIEDGEIDQELIQISSSSKKIIDVKSFIRLKYAYPIGEWYKKASFLLFSNQSRISYIIDKKEIHNNFLDLIMHNDVKKNEFKEYQIQQINWLFENNIIVEADDGNMRIADDETVFILKELHDKDVLNYWHYPKSLRHLLDIWETKDKITFESSLFTRNEQNYFNYYLNKQQFTNGYDLRNRYLHGTNPDDKKQHELDYFSILKLFIIIIIKINDDLCLRDDNSEITSE